MVAVRARASLVREGKPASETEADEAVRQAIRDTVEGTYQPLPGSGQGAVLDHFEIDGPVTNFAFSMPAEMFPAEAGGLQHLVGVLAGDTFSAPSNGVSWTDFQVRHLELPASIKDRCSELFGSKAPGASGARDHFRLADDLPLLAYSFKPRTGPAFDAFADDALGVLEAGFNLVEPDTRRLTTFAELDEWSELGRRAAQVRPGETAFAPNLTMPADLVQDCVRRWRKAVPEGPFVIKVDAGLDGLSTIQAIRRLEDIEAPIITCYPLLRGTLAERIGPVTLVELMTLCGADIVYPGFRPTFAEEKRPIWAKQHREAARGYQRMLENTNVMPTFAGGVDPADLQVAYELLGPGTGMFLGGAVALHHKGSVAGAKVCVEVLHTAAKLAARAKGPVSDTFDTKLIDKIQKDYPQARKYIEPAAVFEASPETPDPPLPWHKRTA